MIEYSDWQDYLKRSDDPYGKLYSSGKILSDPEQGFVTYDIDLISKSIFVHQMYGNGKYWISLLKEIAKKYNINEIRCFTKRNPKAIIRKYGAEVTGYTMTLEIK